MENIELVHNWMNLTVIMCGFKQVSIRDIQKYEWLEREIKGRPDIDMAVLETFRKEIETHDWQ